TLRPSEPREKPVDFAVRRNAINGIEAGRGRPGHVQIIVETESEMIGGDARLERRENKNLFARADFENAAASIAHVKIAVAIERNTGRDAHTFREELRSSRRIH